MKAIRLIMCVAVGIILLFNANGCDNNKKVNNDSNSQSEQSEKKESSNLKSVSSEKLVLIDFYATWCGPCKAMTPVMEEMEKKYGDRIEFKKVDVDKNEELAQKYNVQSIPNIVILSPHEEVLKNVIGYRDSDEMDEILNEVLNQ